MALESAMRASGRHPVDMSLIKSMGNKTTELRFREALDAAGVSGYAVQPDMEHSPDLVFFDSKVAIWLDGCFWHGCWRHFRTPKTNWRYWSGKIRQNRRNDARATAAYARAGWTVFRVLEHDIQDGQVLKDIALRVARKVEGETESVPPGALSWDGPTRWLKCAECQCMRAHYMLGARAECAGCGRLSLKAGPWESSIC